MGGKLLHTALLAIVCCVYLIFGEAAATKTIVSEVITAEKSETGKQETTETTGKTLHKPTELAMIAAPSMYARNGALILSGVKSSDKIAVFDFAGKQIKSIDLSTGQDSLSLHSLRNGMYLIRWRRGTKSLAHKVLTVGFEK